MWKIYKCLRHLRVKFRDAYSINQSSATQNDESKHRQSSGYCLCNYRSQFWQDEGVKNKNKTSRKHSGTNIDLNDYGSFFEAVGWGTFLLLGIQYVSLKWNGKDIYKKQDDGIKDALQRFAPISWQLSPWKLHVLPSTSETTIQFPLQLEFDSKSSLETSSSLTEFSEENLDDLNIRQDLGSPSINEFTPIIDEFVSVIQNNVGVDLVNSKKLKDALNYFEAACELGNSSACFNSAVCYQTGSGTEKDISKAVKYYQRAADLGHVTAMYNLSLLYLDKDDSDKNINKALNLMESAAKLGVLEAQKFMAVHYMESEDMIKAVPFLEAAVEKNDVDCRYYLGLCYENGWGLEENLVKAAECYSKASEKGHLDAMYNFAVFTELGLGGLERQPDVALEMYSKAAGEGHVESISKMRKIEQEQQTNNYKLTKLDESVIRNSSSLPDISRLNLNSSAISKCLSDNLSHLQKQIILSFKKRSQAVNKFENFSDNDDFVEYMWNHSAVIT